MNPHDHAVVIGVSRYRTTQPPWLAELNGPDNDADAVAAWLRDQGGGGLPQGNVHVIRSADFPADRPMAPLQAEVEAAFDELSTLDRSGFDGSYSGRRLYVFVSGHGFAQQVDEAILITADARPGRPLNIVVTSWLKWFYTASRFKEYVLWADCCRTRVPVGTPKTCDLVPEYGDDPDNSSQFIAFAAPFKKRAVENDFDGTWHGVFTYALLQALKGNAVGDVTGKSVSGYLAQNMETFLSDDQRRSSQVAKAPTFVKADDIAFTTPAVRPTFPVALQFPADCVGKHAKVAVNNSAPPVHETQLGATVWEIQLPTGLWCAFVPDRGIAQPFEVKGGGSDAVVTIS